MILLTCKNEHHNKDRAKQQLFRSRKDIFIIIVFASNILQFSLFTFLIDNMKIVKKYFPFLKINYRGFETVEAEKKHN